MGKEVKVKEDYVPADLSDRYAGMGTSHAADDNLVPLVYILQKQSPQVEKQDVRHIKNAEAGDIWLRNAPKEIVKGSDGILFQPCFFAINWIEWVPRERGGGFVARHDERPDDANRMVDPQNPNRIRYLRPNGNEVIQTRNHIGYVLENGSAIPFVIPMTSSGHTISRTWMSEMNRHLITSGPNKGKTEAAFKYTYRMKTRLRQNQFGSWYTWDIKQEGGAVSTDQFNLGLQLHQGFVSGQRQTEAPAAPEEQQEEM
jgi:hypothetical protein